MNEDYDKKEKSINWLQVFSGIFLLIIGALVYFTDRPFESAYFLTRFEFLKGLHNTLSGINIPLGNYLPDFIHPFAFILITGGIVSCKKRGYIIICSAWFFIDCIFELGQKYHSIFLKFIPDWFSEIPFLEAFEGYFQKGTFDPYDIIAILAGTGAAYIFLIFTTEKN